MHVYIHTNSIYARVYRCIYVYAHTNASMLVCVYIYMGGCQNYGPFLGTLNIRGRIIIGTPKRDHNFDDQPYRDVHLYVRHVLMF